jgi:hypothetical protein
VQIKIADLTVLAGSLRAAYRRNVQTETMEMLLRLIRDLPERLYYLRRCAA